MHECRVRRMRLTIAAVVGVIAWNGTAAAGPGKDAPTKQQTQSAKAAAATKAAAASRAVEADVPGTVAPPLAQRGAVQASSKPPISGKGPMPGEELGLGCSRTD